MDVLLVAHESDAIALQALKFLAADGYTTRIMSDGVSPPLDAIALFSARGGFRNRFLRVVRHKMAQNGLSIPEWCAGLPFLVALNAETINGYSYSYNFALRQIAEMYAKWGPWMRQPEAPWNPGWKNGEPHEAFAAWRAETDAVARSTLRVDRIKHRVQPIFPTERELDITSIVVTGCAIFNKPHTDVVRSIPAAK